MKYRPNGFLGAPSLPVCLPFLAGDFLTTTGSGSYSTTGSGSYSTTGSGSYYTGVAGFFFPPLFLGGVFFPSILFSSYKTGSYTFVIAVGSSGSGTASSSTSGSNSTGGVGAFFLPPLFALGFSALVSSYTGA